MTYRTTLIDAGTQVYVIARLVNDPPAELMKTVRMWNRIKSPRTSVYVRNHADIFADVVLFFHGHTPETVFKLNNPADYIPADEFLARFNGHT